MQGSFLVSCPRRSRGESDQMGACRVESLRSGGLTDHIADLLRRDILGAVLNLVDERKRTRLHGCFPDLSRVDVETECLTEQLGFRAVLCPRDLFCSLEQRRRDGDGDQARTEEALIGGWSPRSPLTGGRRGSSGDPGRSSRAIRDRAARLRCDARGIHTREAIVGGRP